MKILQITHLGFAFAIVTAVISAGTIGIGSTQAAPLAFAGKLGAAVDGHGLVEQTQFIFEDKEYCWYDDGWHGPGWYWCGYALRQGFGWGGPVGWHDWDRHHPPRPVHGPGSSHNPIVNPGAHKCVGDACKCLGPACTKKPYRPTRKPVGVPNPPKKQHPAPPGSGTGNRPHS